MLVMQVRLALAVVHKPQAVVVAFLVLAAVLEPVAFDNIQECLHTGIHTGIGRVGVQLQHQEGLCPHDPLKVMEHEGVRGTGEVADPCDKDVRVILHIEGGVHILLAIVPVHVGEYLLVADRQDVERNYSVATGSELPRDTDVGLFCKGVVRAA